MDGGSLYLLGVFSGITLEAVMAIIAARLGLFDRRRR